MIDIIDFTKALAAGIQTATGIQTLRDGSTELLEGEFSDTLVLSIGGTAEVVPTNYTYRADFVLLYVAQPELYADTDQDERRAGILENVQTYIESIDRYDELGGAVVLEAQCQPWQVDYDAQTVRYSIPISTVIQL